jgi:hypothetical protein
LDGWLAIQRKGFGLGEGDFKGANGFGMTWRAVEAGPVHGLIRLLHFLRNRSNKGEASQSGIGITFVQGIGESRMQNQPVLPLTLIGSALNPTFCT